MADVAGLAAAFSAVVEAIKGALGGMRETKAARRKRASRVCAAVARNLETLHAELEAWANAPKATRHIAAKKLHAPLGELKTYVGELSELFDGLMNRQKLGALQRRLGALQRSKAFALDIDAMPETLPKELLGLSGEFKGLANTLA